tara:strand:+ start:454 stop:966 length:513 start_codon:yes stop_codon:yes gene_type:complete
VYSILGFEDIIISIDGDDELYNCNVFSTLDKYYKDKNVWMTFGSFLRKNHLNELNEGIKCDGIDFTDIIKNNNFRKTWIYSHLKTYKYKLFKKIKNKDLKINGKYVKAAQDMAVMYPMIEMSGGKFKCIPDILYIYNSNHPETNHSNDKKKNMQIDNKIHIQSLEPYKPI